MEEINPVTPTQTSTSSNQVTSAIPSAASAQDTMGASSTEPTQS